jgi:hypothetical protein
MNEDLGKWILPLATAIGAWGGFPDAPQVFKDVVESNELFRYLMVFVLVWQGGGGQNVRTAFIATAIVYFVTKLLEVRRMIQVAKEPAPPAEPPMQAPEQLWQY